MRKDDRVITACGCLVIPDVLIMYRLIDNRKASVECPEHGWQHIVRNATGREKLNHAIGFPLDYQPPIPPDDEIPF
jgi:hypothetical protein